MGNSTDSSNVVVSHHTLKLSRHTERDTWILHQKKTKKLDQNKLGCGLGVTLNLLSEQTDHGSHSGTNVSYALEKAMTRVEKYMRKTN